MQHYYFNLPKDKELDINTNLSISEGIRNTARRAFEPFEFYLQNAITALEKKQNIKAKWKKVKTENIAELRLIGKIFDVPKQTIVEIKNSIANEIQAGTVIRGSERDHTVIAVNGINVVFDNVPEQDEMLFWNKKAFEYKIISASQPKGTIIREEEKRYIIYVENGQKPNETSTEIQHKKLASFIDFENLNFENGHSLNAIRNNDLNITLSDTKDFNKIVICDKLKFKIENTRKNSKDAFWIQLLELDDNANDDIPGFSPLKYFFDDGIEIVYPRAITAMLEMITAVQDYDILGHFDYVSRYNKSGSAKMLYKHAPDEFDSLFKKMAESEKCLEINTRTTVRMRSKGYDLKNSFPDQAIIKRFLELGGKYVSIGSDSHHYGDAALIFTEMKDWLLSVGVDKLTYYVEREPVQYKI